MRIRMGENEIKRALDLVRNQISAAYSRRPKVIYLAINGCQTNSQEFNLTNLTFFLFQEIPGQSLPRLVAVGKLKP